jgi:peptide/nickel transport system permease protein
MSAAPENLTYKGDAKDTASVRPDTPFKRFWSDFTESPIAVGGLIVICGIAVLAIFAPWLSPTNPYDLTTVSIMDSRIEPGGEMMSGKTAYLGTDGSGRDMVSAMLYGLRISLGVGAGSGIIALTIGVVVGLTAAYFGGRTDAFIMRAVDMQLSFPAILVALVLLVTLGKGIDKTIIALVVVQWAYYARTIRATALVERRKEYIESAVCLALSKNRIMFRHLLPNCLAPIIVVGTVQIASAISLEATLSFLGLGMPETEPSLGRLIANGFEYIMSGKYWISIYPGIALLVTIVSINLVGDRLRDVLNPRLQR